MKNRIIWITGISGVGKTTLAKNIIQKLKRKKIYLIHLDGDEFRKTFKNDLGYTLRDRNLNAERLISFVNLLNNQGFSIIISANLTSKKFLSICKKKFLNFFHVHIICELEALKKRDSKKIYKKNKNIVGIHIKNPKIKNANILIKNKSTKKEFLSNGSIIIKKLFKKFN